MRLTERALTITHLKPAQGSGGGGHHIAISPVSWGVSDLRGWGQQLEAERVLREVGSLGVPAIEAGPTGFLPDRSEAARSVLKRHQLRAVAGPVRAVLHHHDIRAAELAHIDGHASWLASLGAHTLILTVISSRSDDMPGVKLSSTGWAHLLSAIGSVQHVCTVHRLRLAVEPRQGSMIQGPTDIERLLVGSEAGVCLDLAQLVLAGADPIEVIELSQGRIQHVHINDIDQRQAARVREGAVDYATAVSGGMLKTLGTGDANVAAVVDALHTAGYRGWYGLEAETRLSSVDDDPVGEVRASLDYLRSVLPTSK
jgi:inosose dehydratase